MKIRNGFVSNSSSSSFILRFGDENFPDTVSIAESMLKDKYADYGYDGYTGWQETAAKAFKNIEKLKKAGDPYIPIYFSSCNYNTYIIPLTTEYVLVETCNNTNWSVSDSDSVVHSGIPEEVMKRYPKSDGYGGNELYIREGDEVDEYGETISVIYNKAFYLVEYGVEMVTPPGYKSCDTCYNDVWYFGGKEYCMNCDWDKIIRSLKIKKIKNVFTQN